MSGPQSDSSTMIGVSTDSRTRRSASMLPGGIGCSTEWMSNSSSRLMARIACFGVFQPMLASVRMVMSGPTARRIARTPATSFSISRPTLTLTQR